MDEKSYEAIKLKIDKDKNEILLEIAVLQQKRLQHKEILKKEIRKLEYTKELFMNGPINSALLKRPSYRHDVVENEKKQIEKIEGYIRKQNEELEKINEKNRLIDELYQEKLNEKYKKERRQEEEALIEMKSFFERKSQGGE